MKMRITGCGASELAASLFVTVELSLESRVTVLPPLSLSSASKHQKTKKEPRIFFFCWGASIFKIHSLVLDKNKKKKALRFHKT